MRKVYLGIDVGTTGCKAIAIDSERRSLGVASVRYDESLVSLGLGAYDQDADVLLDASIRCIRQLAEGLDKDCQVVSLGFTGQMHGLVALDENLKPIRPIISCVDFRNMAQNDVIAEAFGGETGLLPYTNNKMVPSCTGGKLVWMKENEPELYARIHTVINPKDYIRTALTGIAGTDESDASGFGLYDVKNHCWSQPLLEKLGISSSIMPRIYVSGETVGSILPEMAEKLGIGPDAVAVAGAGDAIMQTVGSGAVETGTYSVILGSGGLISASLKTCVENTGAKMQVYNSALKNEWVAYAGLMSIGNSTNWMREKFYQDAGATPAEQFACMEEEVKATPPGSHNLLFFPTLLGQRNPVEAPFAKGVIVGLTITHTRADIYRSMLEGLCLGMREVSHLLENLNGEPVQCIHLSGGGASCDTWCQMLADVFQVPVKRIREYAACGAMGAATLGITRDMSQEETVAFFARTEHDRVFEPDPSMKAVYDDLYDMYIKLFPATCSLFDDLKAFEEKYSN